MILGDDAVSAMWKHLNSHIGDIGLGKERIFKYERPEKLAVGSYIVINHLPFVRRNVIEEGVVNVNIHVPKTSSNEPNSKEMLSYVKKVLSLFDNGKASLGGCIFEFYADSRPTRDNDDTYYINLKFNVTYNNLKE